MPECAEEFKARILKPLQGLLDQIQGVQQHLSQEPQVHPLQTRRPEQHAGSSSYKSCNIIFRFTTQLHRVVLFSWLVICYVRKDIKGKWITKFVVGKLVGILYHSLIELIMSHYFS